QRAGRKGGSRACIAEPMHGVAHHGPRRGRVVLSGCLRDQPGGRGEDLLEPAGQIDATTGVVRPWKVLELTAARIEPGRGHVRAYTSDAGIDGAGNTVVAGQRRVNAPGRRAQVHGARIPVVAT